MKKQLFPFVIFLFTTFIFLFSCQQEIDNILPRIQRCRIDMSHFYGGGGMHDSGKYTYDADGKVTRIETIDGHYLFEYSGSGISVRKYYEGNTNLWYIDSVKYDATGNVLQVVSLDYSMMWGDTAHYKLLFDYTNGKMSMVRNIQYYDYGAGPMSDTLYTRLKWNAAGNLEKLLHIDITTGDVADSAVYRFNTHENYFRIIHPHFWLFDPNFQVQVGLEAHLPYFYSKNNVEEFDLYGGTVTYDVEYALDSLNKVTGVDIDGFEYAKYQYKCD